MDWPPRPGQLVCCIDDAPTNSFGIIEIKRGNIYTVREVVENDELWTFFLGGPDEPGLMLVEVKRERDPESIGLFWMAGPSSAVDMCRMLRIADVRNPLFALIDEALAGAPARALVLNAGADDAQTWPINATELVSRLFALQRRQRDGNLSIIQLPGCILKTATGELIGDVARIHLTSQEASLLSALASRPGAVMTKPMCMLALYNGRDEPAIKIVDVLVCKLRKKIGAATGGLDVIETIWGQGFRFNADGYEPSFSPFGQRVPR